MVQIKNIAVSPVSYKNKFLLIKRIKHPYKGLWSLVGGHLEAGEHIEDTIIREVEEETSLKVKFIAVRGIVSEILYDKNKKVSGHYLIWVCETCPHRLTAQRLAGAARAKTTFDVAKEMNEGKVKWFTKEELIKNKNKIIPSDLAMIKEFFLSSKKNLKIHKSHMHQDGKKYQLEYFGT